MRPPESERSYNLLRRLYPTAELRGWRLPSYRWAFRTAQSRAGWRCRCHDAQHTLVMRLAENLAISEQTKRPVT